MSLPAGPLRHRCDVHGDADPGDGLAAQLSRAETVATASFVLGKPENAAAAGALRVCSLVGLRGVAADEAEHLGAELAQRCPNLEHLALGASIRAAHIAALAGGMPRIGSLELLGTILDDATLTALGGWRLRILRLGRDTTVAARAAALLQLTSLRAIEAEDCPLAERDVAALLRLSALETVRLDAFPLSTAMRRRCLRRFGTEALLYCGDELTGLQAKHADETWCAARGLFAPGQCTLPVRGGQITWPDDDELRALIELTGANRGAPPARQVA